MPGMGVPQLGEAAGDAAAADVAQGDPGDQQAAHHQQRDLDDVGQRHRLQAAVQLVGQREQAEQGERQHLVHAGDLVHRDRSQPQDRGQVHEYVQAQPEHRHQRADPRAVPFLQELRHGVDAVAQEDRQEELADDQQGRRRHPLVRRDRQADGIAGAGHADDLLGRDVGRDQRGADRPPRQRAAGEEVVGGRLLVPGLLARHPLRQGEDARQVHEHDHHIECCQLHAPSPGRRPSSCGGHGPPPDAPMASGSTGPGEPRRRPPGAARSRALTARSGRTGSARLR